MFIFSQKNVMMPGTSSYVKHLKRIQMYSLMPLSLDNESFSHVSKLRTMLSLVVLVVNLIHIWMPEVSFQWYNTGPVSAVLIIMLKILHSAVPAMFAMSSLMYRRQFEKTSNNFLIILKSLDLWEYRIFNSCKTANIIFSLGMLALVARNAAILWSDTNKLMVVIDDVLWGLYYVYFFSWAYLFFYTVRVIEACFLKITQKFIAESANLDAYIQTYNRLVDIASETNDFYDIPVSLVLLILLLGFLDYTSQALSGSMSLVDQLYVFLWVLILVVLLVCILGNCNSTSDQANRSNEALFKYLIHQKDLVNIGSPLLTIHLCARKRLEFKACKSFTINYNLGLSMFAAYVTYLVVLYQIDHSSPSLPVSDSSSNQSQQNWTPPE